MTFLIACVRSLFAVLFLFTYVSAASLMVTRSDDRDLMCQPADCSLREAVKAANMNPGPDSILFATGLSVIQIREITFAGSDPTTILGPGAMCSK